MRVEEVVLVVYNSSRLSKSTDCICLSLVPCFWGDTTTLTSVEEAGTEVARFICTSDFILEGVSIIFTETRTEKRT